jgi:hypothetical protein
MPWPRKPDRVINENGKPRRMLYTSPYAPRCRVCGHKTDFWSATGSSNARYCECTNPRCPINGFKIDSEGKLLNVWLGKLVDYRTKKEKLNEPESKSVEDLDWGFDVEKWHEEQLENWRKLQKEYEKRKKQCRAEQQARWKLKDWRPEDGEQ